MCGKDSSPACKVMWFFLFLYGTLLDAIMNCILHIFTPTKKKMFRSFAGNMCSILKWWIKWAHTGIKWTENACWHSHHWGCGKWKANRKKIQHFTKSSHGKQFDKICEFAMMNCRWHIHVNKSVALFCNKVAMKWKKKKKNKKILSNPSNRTN